MAEKWISKCPACKEVLHVDECMSETCFNCGVDMSQYTVEELEANAERVEDTDG